MAEEKSFRYGFIILGFFLVMVGMFIMSVEKPQYYITFCVLGVLLVAVGITWSMCQCYPKVTFIPADLEAERFLDHKPTVLPQKDSGWVPQQEASSTYEKSLPSYEQIQRQVASSAPLPPLAQPRSHSCSQSAVQARAEIHQELGGAGDPHQGAPQPPPSRVWCHPVPAAPSLEGSVPGSPTPQSRTLPSYRPDHPPSSAPGRGEHPRSPRRDPGEEDDLYYGLQEEPDALLKESDGLFEPE
ncbi:BSND protein, partial [Sitta europaea]|nr:BSND protein [Sitta europaea]